MENCNHNNMTTNYCPDCGTELLKNHPLSSLLEHIRVGLRIKRRRLEGIDSELPSKENSAFILQAEKNIRKWVGWEACLLDIMKYTEKKTKCKDCGKPMTICRPVPEVLCYECIRKNTSNNQTGTYHTDTDRMP
jgi:predicted amidophosphoribosyltransferase